MNLKEYIKSKNESINSLSDKLKIPYATLHNGINNPKQLKYMNILKLSKYFGVSFEYLTSFFEEKSPTFLSILIDQMESKLKGNIYHFTQIDLTYNTNRIEGSQLTKDQTRSIFETNTVGIDNINVNTNDLIETANSFYLFDEMLKSADNYISEDMIKRFHQILKNGTNDSRKDWFVVGGYKKMPNSVSGEMTTPPKEVGKAVKNLLKWYNSIEEINFNDIIKFHYRFESIHPFQDGNGRIGRILMFKECLRNNIVPFVISDKRKAYYYRGLKKYKTDEEYLLDTCLSMQDDYKLNVKKYLEDVYDLKTLLANE